MPDYFPGRGIDLAEHKINASRDWLRAMQQTAAAVSQRSRTFSCARRSGRYSWRQDGYYRAGRCDDLFRAIQRANRYSRFAIANGIQKGDSVALLAPNSAEYLAAWLGISATGATVALINTNLRGKMLAHSFAAASAKAAFISGELADAYSHRRHTSPLLCRCGSQERAAILSTWT